MPLETVHFRIKRKLALSGCLRAYRLFINGERIGVIKNGGALETDIPKADKYFIDCESGDENGIIANCCDSYNIEIRCSGGRSEFYVIKDESCDKLPSLSYEKYYSAIHNDNLFSELTEAEKVFARALEFREEAAEAPDAVLYSEHYAQMLEAISRIGAKKYCDVFKKVSDTLFEGVSLPITDEAETDDIIKAASKANKMVLDCEKRDNPMDELHKCIVNYILDKLAVESE